MRNNRKRFEQATKYGFNLGYSQVPKRHLIAVREDILEALDRKTNSTFTNKRYGYSMPTLEEGQKIEKVFAKYGIKKVWGIVENEVENDKNE